jgi:3',5'-cyclic AMP phosphodiesterase CpdA
VATRILHVSDLHIGTREDAAVARALTMLIERLSPRLLIASGDLTHRGLPEQHDLAAAFLRGFDLPLHVVAGNHDMPYRLPARFTRTWTEFERVWGATESVYSADDVHVVGLHSPRPWLYQEGLVRRAQLDRVARELARAPEGALRVVVLHHHLLGAPWRNRKLPVFRRERVLAALVESGAELVLAGHIHQAAISERREFEVTTGDVRAVVISIAPGLGQPRPQRRGEARGLHVYEADDDTMAVSTYIWRDDDWALTAKRLFPRGMRPLTVSAEHPGP